MAKTKSSVSGPRYGADLLARALLPPPAAPLPLQAGSCGPPVRPLAPRVLMMRLLPLPFPKPVGRMVR